jgi:hypothetical protein
MHGVDSAGVFAEPPVWLISMVAAPEVSQLDERRPPQHWTRISKGVEEGARNMCAASLAGYLLSHGVRPAVTLDLMLAWNTRNSPPLEEHAIVRTVESIATRELAKRRRV